MDIIGRLPIKDLCSSENEKKKETSIVCLCVIFIVFEGIVLFSLEVVCLGGKQWEVVQKMVPFFNFESLQLDSGLTTILISLK